ncbi:MAG: CoA-binding protein [Nitrospirae bacterium]|nr:CoA-binding protein [Nitrospirota bacterium]
MRSLDALFNPGSIALVGAAHEEIKLGGTILRNLLSFRGKVYPINPKYRELMGIRAYPSVLDLPEPVDLMIIMRPGPEVPDILRHAAGRTKYAVVMSSGFAEIGETALQDEVKNIGRDSGIRILGPNCMGLYNPWQKLDTFFLPKKRLGRPKKGNVAIVSQSGAILSCLLGAVQQVRRGVSKAVGYGNAADIDESEIYEYLSEDRRTDVVVSYIESVGDGRRFVEKARALSEKKELIILKSGKGSSGQAAAFSHTGRLAGRYEVFHSIVRQTGIREAMDFDELMDAAKALSLQGTAQRSVQENPPSPPFVKGGMGEFEAASGQIGRRICIVTNGGGSGVLAADECMRQGLEVINLEDGARERLRQTFPHFYGINNPLDLTAQVKDRDYAVAMEELREDYDAFLLIALPNVLGITEGLAEAIRETFRRLQKPAVFYIGQGGISRRLTASLERMGIPVYPSPERAVRGLKALLK